MLQTIRSYGAGLVRAPGTILSAAQSLWDLAGSGSIAYATTASEIREDISTSAKGSPERSAHQNRLKALKDEYSM